MGTRSPLLATTPVSPLCVPAAAAAAPFWLTDTSGDPHRGIGAGLTLKEPVDEGAWEWGILKKKIKEVWVGVQAARGRPRTGHGRTCKSSSKKCPDVTGKLERAEWIFPRSPKEMTPGERERLSGLGRADCPVRERSACLEHLGETGRAK